MADPKPAPDRLRSLVVPDPAPSGFADERMLVN
jgi:hypothetical protein